MSTIGQRIHNRRLQLGLSADQVAEKLGKNRATIYRYESDDIENLPISVVAPLAEILGVSPAYIMGWTQSDAFFSKTPVKTNWTGKLRELLSDQIGHMDPADLQAACEEDACCCDIVDFVNSEKDVSFEEACNFAEHAGISIDADVLENAPIPMDERTSEVIRLFGSLDQEHQETLVQVLRGLLADQAARSGGQGKAD